jgi:capsular polysaccharide transport system permease protein
MYQNAHNTIDPNLDVQSRSTILANLESDLIKKTVEFQSGGRYMIKNSPEQKIAKNTIENLKKEIKRVKKEIAGTGIGKKELNQVVFDFELLRNDIDFSKEVYKQSLEKLEELRSEVNQNIKNLLVINRPTLAEKYTYPEKPKKILTIFIILAFLYSILISIITLLRDHRD